MMAPAVVSVPGYGGRDRLFDAAGNLIAQTCNGCGKTLPVSKFHRHGGIRYGFATRCKECERERAAKRYAGNRIAQLTKALIHRAKQRGVFCDLTTDDVQAVYDQQAGRCFYTGVEFGDIGTENTMSVDRVEPSRGYTRDNIVLCCIWVNVMKLDYNVEDFLSRVAAIAGRIGELEIRDEIAPYVQAPRENFTDKGVYTWWKARKAVPQ